MPTKSLLNLTEIWTPGEGFMIIDNTIPYCKVLYYTAPHLIQYKTISCHVISYRIP